MIRDMHNKALLAEDLAELERYRKDKIIDKRIKEMGNEIASLKNHVEHIKKIVDVMYEERNLNG
jgi:DNA-binding transcriptional regulator GbsR (MarR family)